MISFSEESRENIKAHFTMFLETVRRQETENVSPSTIADWYIDNEISMNKGMKEYHDYLDEQNRKNHRLLNAIKTVKGKTFFKYLMEIINESEGISGMVSIVSTPTGEFQKEKYGRQINGIWVEQWSTGMEGDSFDGFVCVQIKPNKYLKFGYSM